MKRGCWCLTSVAIFVLGILSILLFQATMLEGLVTTLLSLDSHDCAPPHQLLLSKRRSRSNSLSSATGTESLSISSSDEDDSSLEQHDSALLEDDDNDHFTTTSNNKRQRMFHPPPPGIDYDSNDTVFGAILRGDVPAQTLAESTTLLAFEDIKPRAPLHALIIPKAFVGSVFDLRDTDLRWIHEMQRMAMQLIHEYHPEAYETGDYRLAFHIPPFNSVDHLHLHVLAPLSSMRFYYRNIKYATPTRWCMDLERIVARLERGDGESAVPYRRPVGWKPQYESPTTTSPSIVAEEAALQDKKKKK
jgi:diadenosine tetraphosphate (Ap4A) HIT family hydrolase